MPEATSSRNGRRAWTAQHVQQLRELADGNTPPGVMSIKLERSQDSIQSKARSEGISLAPANRSPHGDVSRPRGACWCRGDGNTASNSRSTTSRSAGTAQISPCTAAFTSLHHAAAAFAAERSPNGTCGTIRSCLD
jgi:hypothetical protein